MSDENTNLPPKVNPLGGAPEAEKQKPVLRKPVLGARPAPLSMPKPPAAAAPAAQPAPDASAQNAVEQLKKITQNLKSITAPIPQQAILRNTGIIGSLEMTEAQKAAAKARTSRIALSDAIGAASVKEESAPIKTIKIQRPKVVPRKPVVPTAAAPAAASAVAQPEPAAVETQETVSITQKKTLKVARPGISPARPKFGIKKPGSIVKAASPAAAKAEEKKPAAQDGEVADLEPVEMTEVPELPATLPADVIPAVPKGVAIAGVILQVAACAVIGVLAYFLYQDTQLPLFCGGCTP